MRNLFFSWMISLKTWMILVFSIIFQQSISANSFFLLTFLHFSMILAIFSMDLKIFLLISVNFPG